mmetsp:Transcript_18140/g.36576  ORF Transcript_18140/g.36576 Transcript_18140/m.36576 type:complete len:236 (+) Transcript_18140:554-1261(+)
MCGGNGAIAGGPDAPALQDCIGDSVGDSPCEEHPCDEHACDEPPCGGRNGANTSPPPSEWPPCDETGELGMLFEGSTCTARRVGSILIRSFSYGLSEPVPSEKTICWLRPRSTFTSPGLIQQATSPASANCLLKDSCKPLCPVDSAARSSSGSRQLTVLSRARKAHPLWGSSGYQCPWNLVLSNSCSRSTKMPRCSFCSKSWSPNQFAACMTSTSHILLPVEAAASTRHNSPENG